MVNRSPSCGAHFRWSHRAMPITLCCLLARAQALRITRRLDDSQPGARRVAIREKSLTLAPPPSDCSSARAALSTRNTGMRPTAFRDVAMSPPISATPQRCGHRLKRIIAGRAPDDAAASWRVGLIFNSAADGRGISILLEYFAFRRESAPNGA